MTAEFDTLEKQGMEAMERIYNKIVVDHAMLPRNVGNISQADGFGRITGPCGDTMEIWLKVESDEVRKATFWTDGCGATIACGSMITEMVKNLSIVQALRIKQKEVLNSLGGLPEDNVHCALLAANTLREAIRDYQILKKEPWRKAYRK